jgi:hypothetical protein
VKTRKHAMVATSPCAKFMPRRSVDHHHAEGHPLGGEAPLQGAQVQGQAPGDQIPVHVAGGQQATDDSANRTGQPKTPTDSSITWR